MSTFPGEESLSEKLFQVSRRDRLDYIISNTQFHRHPKVLLPC
jgi:hypothetical protein